MEIAPRVFPMPRPVARPLPPRPTAELPRWVLAAVGLGTLGLAAATLLWNLNRTNQQLQAENRVTADPVAGAWLAEMRAEIDDRQRRGSTPATTDHRRQAEAVWVGRVRSLEFTQREGEGPRLSDVTLKPAYLLAGQRGPLDSRSDSAVRISVLAQQWPRGEPREGESWVFSVYRINQDNNVAHAAFPTP
jgi:hypothetical protein